MATFAGKLVALRRERRLTQAQVANVVGRTSNTVARWERGEISPDALVGEAVLARVAKEAIQRDARWVILQRVWDRLLGSRSPRNVITRAPGTPGFRSRAEAEGYLAAHPQDTPGGWVSLNPKKRRHHG